MPVNTSIISLPQSVGAELSLYVGGLFVFGIKICTLVWAHSHTHTRTHAHTHFYHRIIRIMLQLESPASQEECYLWELPLNMIGSLTVLA